MTTAVAGLGPRITDLGQRLASLQRRAPVAQVAIFVVAMAYGGIAMDGFLSWSSIRSMLVLASLVGIAALGQTLVVLIGGFDLSVSGFIVFAALILTQSLSSSALPLPLVLLLIVVGSIVLGGLSGWLCHRFTVNPIIVTLAMGTAAVGAFQSQTNGAVSGSAPEWLANLSAPISTTFGVPIPPVVVIWVVVAVAMWGFLYRTVSGRRIFATGANDHAAALALTNTRLVWVGVFAFSALAAAAAGLLLAGFTGNVDTSLGDPYLFQSLAAVIVGGTTFGGPGDYWRTVGGAVLLTVLTTVLAGIGLSGAAQNVFYGVVILAAMAFYGRQRRLRDRV